MGEAQTILRSNVYSVFYYHEVIVTGDPYSRRVLTGFWWLFVIVTVTTYCGNLVAFLTFPTIEYPISDLNTLVQKVTGPNVVRL